MYILLDTLVLVLNTNGFVARIYLRAPLISEKIVSLLKTKLT